MESNSETVVERSNEPRPETASETTLQSSPESVPKESGGRKRNVICCNTFKSQGVPQWSLPKDIFASVGDEDEQKCCAEATCLAIDKLVENDVESAPAKCKVFLVEVEHFVASNELDEEGREKVYKKLADAMNLDSVEELERMLASSADADARILESRLEKGKGNGFVQDAKSHLEEQIKVIQGSIESLQKSKADLQSWLDDPSKIEKLHKDLKAQYEREVKKSKEKNLRNGRPSTVFVESSMRTVNYFLGPVSKEETEAYYPHKHDVGARVEHTGDGWREGVIEGKNGDGTYEVLFKNVKEDEIRALNSGVDGGGAGGGGAGGDLPE